LPYGIISLDNISNRHYIEFVTHPTRSTPEGQSDDADNPTQSFTQDNVTEKTMDIKSGLKIDNWKSVMGWKKIQVVTS
jgi:hypothetical protein